MAASLPERGWFGRVSALPPGDATGGFAPFAKPALVNTGGVMWNGAEGISV